MVIGVDGTESGRHALEATRSAADAGLFGADAILVAVHVQSPSPAWWACPITGPVPPPTVALEPRWRNELELDAFCDTASALGGGALPWVFTVDFGDVAGTLARHGQDPDTRLLVVGQRLGLGRRTRRWWHRCPARALTTSGGRSLPPVYVVSWADVTDEATSSSPG